MSQYYQVEQGDYLPQIAAKSGFTDFKTIWDHPKNAQFKQKRKKAVAGGMLRLAVDLADSGQTASAGVVFQRLHGFCYDTTAGRYRVDAPDLDATQRHAVLAALNSPAAGVAAPVRTELQRWLSPQ